MPTVMTTHDASARGACFAPTFALCVSYASLIRLRNMLNLPLRISILWRCEERAYFLLESCVAPGGGRSWTFLQLIDRYLGDRPVVIGSVGELASRRLKHSFS